MKGLNEFRYSQKQGYPVYKCTDCYTDTGGCCVVSGVKNAPKGCLMEEANEVSWTTIDE